MEEQGLLRRAYDMQKEWEDMAHHWKRLLDERGEGKYASFNIGREDVATLNRYIGMLKELREYHAMYLGLCK